MQIQIFVELKSKQSTEDEKQENQLIPISCVSVKKHKPQTQRYCWQTLNNVDLSYSHINSKQTAQNTDFSTQKISTNTKILPTQAL